MQLDPVTFEIIWHRLAQITEEMGLSYFRTSGSHVLISGTDASTAVMSPDGSMVAVGPYIVTQGNVLSLMVESTLRSCQENPGIHDGDTFICNDPYLGAIHQPDVATLSPVFHEGELVAWVGVSGHQLDTGGMDPGGFSVRAVEIHQEGLRMPPVKIVEEGELREDILRWIRNQVRDELVALDVRAQIAANHVGRARLKDLIAQYGLETVRAVMEESIAYSERQLRARLRELPDGVWHEVQFIDHDGHEPNVYQIVLTMMKEGDKLVFDFSGTSRQSPGLINCTYSGLLAGVLTPVYMLLGHDLPWNKGILNCLEIRSERGTINNCVYPAPCAMATISAVIVTIDAVFLALSKMLAASEKYRVEAMANWAGSSMAPIFSGISQHGYAFAHTEMSHFGGGGGARTYKDGVDTAGIIFNTTPNIPNIESLEGDFPVLYLFRRQLRDSGGPGRFRGGQSGELAYIIHDAPEGRLEALFAGTGAEMPNANGLSGGLPGAAIRVLRVLDTDLVDRLAAQQPLPGTLEDITGTREILPPKHPRSPFLPGEVWYHNWQGGGGYGDPLDRDPDLVWRDVLDQAVSADVARRVYGVAIDPESHKLDPQATEQARLDIRQARLKGGTPRPMHPPRDPSPGRLRFGEYLEIDPVGGGVACLRCDFAFDVTDQDFTSKAVVEEVPVTAAGPVRGEDYDRGRFWLRLYYCPGCGAMLHTEVGHPGAPRPWMRLGGQP